ncbi:MAG: hypothetical protein H6754_03875 [Candidatus Omnitrophica bacterium]|nr:hypothetical protein [Candidatus Omnitrophota bacterium]
MNNQERIYHFEVPQNLLPEITAEQGIANFEVPHDLIPQISKEYGVVDRRKATNQYMQIVHALILSILLIVLMIFIIKKLSRIFGKFDLVLKSIKSILNVIARICLAFLMSMIPATLVFMATCWVSCKYLIQCVDVQTVAAYILGLLFGGIIWFFAFLWLLGKFFKRS